MKLTNMFQNLKIGTKIASGFGLTIILLIFLAYIGYNGIKNVQDRVIKADDTNRLVKYTLETRRAEKNYILRGGENYLSEVRNGIQRILDQTKTTKERFNQLINQNQMDTITSAVINYQRAFNSYVNTENEKVEKMGKMRTQANQVLTQIELLRQDQKDQLSTDQQAGLGITQIQQRVIKADDAGRIIWWFLEARKHEKEYIISGEQQWHDDHKKRMGEIMELADGLKSRFRKQLNINQINAVISALNSYQTNFNSFISIQKQQDQIETNKLNAARKVIDTSETARTDQKDKMEKAVTRATTLLLTFILVAIVLAFVISYTITNSITQPLNTIVDLAEHIAIGDMDVNIPSIDRQDELGKLVQEFSRMIRFLKEMAKTANMISEGDLTVDVKPQSERDMLGNAFLLMVENLRKQNKEIIEAVNVLTTMVSEISATSSQLTASSTETVTAIGETTTTVEEVKQTAEVANERAKAISENSAKTVQVARDGEKSVDETTSGMTRIREQMEFIAESIMKLSEQSQAIGEIMNSINDLAEQSNLLAVNASIEAAKAGEEGKGFSVVAEEVKSLADQSKQATIQVREILTDIQKATSTAVMATEEGSKAVESGTKQAADAGTAIKALAESIDEAAQATTQISASVQQQFAGVDQVNEAIRSISTASNQNLESTKQLEEASEKLDELGKNLSKLVEQYKV